jgi:phage shock protein A
MVLTAEDLDRRAAALERAQGETTETLRWVVTKLARLQAVQDEHTLRLERLETKVDKLDDVARIASSAGSAAIAGLGLFLSYVTSLRVGERMSRVARSILRKDEVPQPVKELAAHAVHHSIKHAEESDTDQRYESRSQPTSATSVWLSVSLRHQWLYHLRTDGQRLLRRLLL